MLRELFRRCLILGGVLSLLVNRCVLLVVLWFHLAGYCLLVVACCLLVICCCVLFGIAVCCVLFAVACLLLLCVC